MERKSWWIVSVSKCSFLQAKGFWMMTLYVKYTPCGRLKLRLESRFALVLNSEEFLWGWWWQGLFIVLGAGLMEQSWEGELSGCSSFWNPFPWWLQASHLKRQSQMSQGPRLELVWRTKADRLISPNAWSFSEGRAVLQKEQVWLSCAFLMNLMVTYQSCKRPLRPSSPTPPLTDEEPREVKIT